MTSHKPHQGKIHDWFRIQLPSGGYCIYGRSEGHPQFNNQSIRTTPIVNHDRITGEIETQNSLYTLVGPEWAPVTDNPGFRSGDPVSFPTDKIPDGTRTAYITVGLAIELNNRPGAVFHTATDPRETVVLPPEQLLEIANLLSAYPRVAAALKTIGEAP